MESRQQPDNSLEDFIPFLSPYLMGGYKQDQLEIETVRVESDGIFSSCSVPQHFVPLDGSFHFTAPLAFIVIAQLGIIYAHINNGLQRKESEILVREITLKCRRVITKTRHIDISLVQKHRRRVPQGIYYVGGISVDDGAFEGQCSFLLPLDSGAAAI